MSSAWQAKWCLQPCNLVESVNLLHSNVQELCYWLETEQDSSKVVKNHKITAHFELHCQFLVYFKLFNSLHLLKMQDTNLNYKPVIREISQYQKCSIKLNLTNFKKGEIPFLLKS